MAALYVDSASSSSPLCNASNAEELSCFESDKALSMKFIESPFVLDLMLAELEHSRSVDSRRTSCNATFDSCGAPRLGTFQQPGDAAEQTWSAASMLVISKEGSDPGLIRVLVDPGSFGMTLQV